MWGEFGSIGCCKISRVDCWLLIFKSKWQDMKNLRFLLQLSRSYETNLKCAVTGCCGLIDGAPCKFIPWNLIPKGIILRGGDFGVIKSWAQRPCGWNYGPSHRGWRRRFASSTLLLSEDISFVPSCPARLASLPSSKDKDAASLLSEEVATRDPGPTVSCSRIQPPKPLEMCFVFSKLPNLRFLSQNVLRHRFWIKLFECAFSFLEIYCRC